jgi:hypothetical protein
MNGIWICPVSAGLEQHAVTLRGRRAVPPSFLKCREEGRGSKNAGHGQRISPDTSAVPYSGRESGYPISP